MKLLRKFNILLLSLISGLFFSVPESYSLPIAHLTLQSQHGDYIGQGQNFDITYTPENSDYFFPQVRRTTLGEPSELLFVLGTVTSGMDNTFALLFFGTDQLGIPIQPGFYANAERADFASSGHPGLDVSFQNRGSNEVTGNFTIYNVSFSQSAAIATGSPIESFSVSFEQHSEGAIPALFGTFTYDAFASEVPEPSTMLLVGSGLTGLIVLRKRRKA